MNKVAELIAIIRSNYRIPGLLSIGRYAIMYTQDYDIFAINYHTKEKVFTMEELLSVSDEELIIKCFTK